MFGTGRKVAGAGGVYIVRSFLCTIILVDFSLFMRYLFLSTLSPYHLSERERDKCNTRDSWTDLISTVLLERF
jgi:hypothetical protein